VGVRVHQEVLVVVWKEILYELIAGLGDTLDDETTLLRLDVETTSLSLSD
jgi:hypothetical protein